CSLLCLVQVLATGPWLATVDPAMIRRWLTPSDWEEAHGTEGRQLAGGLILAVHWFFRRVSWGILLLIIGGVGLGLALYLNANQGDLVGWGRFFGSLLHLQLAADFFVLIFVVGLWAWPKGSAVALAAFREGIRQPLFWLLLIIAGFLFVWLPV